MVWIYPSLFSPCLFMPRLERLALQSSGEDNRRLVLLIQDFLASI